MRKVVINLDQIPEELGKQVMDYLESVKPEYITTLARASEIVEDIGKILFRLSSRPALIANNPRREDIARDIERSIRTVLNSAKYETRALTEVYGEDFLDEVPEITGEAISPDVEKIIALLEDV